MTAKSKSIVVREDEFASIGSAFIALLDRMVENRKDVLWLDAESRLALERLVHQIGIKASSAAEPDAVLLIALARLLKNRALPLPHWLTATITGMVIDDSDRQIDPRSALHLANAMETYIVHEQQKAIGQRRRRRGEAAPAAMMATAELLQLPVDTIRKRLRKAKRYIAFQIKIT